VAVPRVHRPDPEPARFITIEGRKAQVVEKPTILPPQLTSLLEVFEVIAVHPIPRLGGFARSCADMDHELQLWATGFTYGHDLRLSKCIHCGSIEVRDVSLDGLLGLPTGGQPLRRRDQVLGWYSGRRRAAREYR